VFMEKMAAKSRHEQWMELKRMQQRERAMQQAKDSLAQKWACNSVVVNTLLSIRRLFVLCRQKMPLLKRLKYSARVIMKTFRMYRQWKESKRMEAEVSGGLNLYSVAAHACVPEKRVQAHLLEISLKLEN